MDEFATPQVPFSDFSDLKLKQKKKFSCAMNYSLSNNRTERTSKVLLKLMNHSKLSIENSSDIPNLRYCLAILFSHFHCVAYQNGNYLFNHQPRHSFALKMVIIVALSAAFLLGTYSHHHRIVVMLREPEIEYEHPHLAHWSSFRFCSWIKHEEAHVRKIRENDKHFVSWEEDLGWNLEISMMRSIGRSSAV